jgi:histidinol-phosphate aminotransferase
MAVANKSADAAAAEAQTQFGASPLSAIRAAIGSPIRIGSNENPYGPGPAALSAVSTTATGANRYPGPAVQALVDVVAEKHGVPADHVLLSGGSGDILRAVVRASTSATKSIVAGSPSYESPVRTAQQIGAPVKAVPLTGDQRLDLDAMVAQSAGAGLFYICNPNNPTATAVTGAAVTSAIDRVLAASPETMILVDEAYFEYADLPGFETATSLVRKHPHVVIARTFSKIHGMAGMRVGYAIAQPKTLEALRIYHSSSGMSVMSLAAAAASLKDTEHLEKQVALNRDVRQFTVDAFTKAGYTVAPSDANFIFVDIRRDARGFQEACRAEGVNVGRSFPPMLNWARISIGTRAEMEVSLPVFMKVLSMPPAATARFNQAVLDALPSELT